MRFYHVYYSYPNGRFGLRDKDSLNAYVYGLSCCYIKKLGHEIVLYCNDAGAEALKDLPYDAVYKSLNGIKATACFAAGKIPAHTLEPLGSVYIDGDVIISKQEAIDYITERSKDTDIFVQQEEGGRLADFGFMDDLLAERLQGELKDLCPEWVKFSHSRSVNCGIVIFNNAELKDKYCKAYMGIYETLCRTDFFEDSQKDSNVWVPDMVLEQAYLYDLIKYYGYKYGSIFPYTTDCGDYYCNSAIGFRHYCYDSKYTFIERIKAELRVIGGK